MNFSGRWGRCRSLHISRCFSFFHRKFLIFPSVSVLSWIFWWCLKRPDPQYCTFAGPSCGPRWVEPQGIHKMIQRAQTCIFERPPFNNTTVIQRENPLERENMLEFWAGGKKERATLGGGSCGGVEGNPMERPHTLKTAPTHPETNHTHTLKPRSP